MKKLMAYKTIKNMICCMAIIMPLQLNMGLSVINDIVRNDTKKINTNELRQNVVLLDLNKEYCDTECFLVKNDKTINFFAKTFGIQKEHIIEDLIARNTYYKFNKYNIGRLKDKDGNIKQFDSFEKGLIEYLYDFSKINKGMVNNKITPYNGDAEYIIDLIKYYTSIYNNVDTLTALSIGASESGYYQVKYMLRKNNIFGGMSKRGLITYKNIEYGVLTYIRLLSSNYYGRGLDTPEEIGRVYCPVFINGTKVASPHWINLVNNAKSKYINHLENVSFIEKYWD